MTDKEWERFVEYWHSKWINSPDRISVEKYLEWRKDARKKVPC